MSSAITSVIIASGSAIAKVFVIGAIGYVSAKRPRPVPILPQHAMGGISKMNFNLLILPLVYSTLASAVTPETLGSMWFLVVSAIGVICISYGVATLLEKLPFFRVENRTDFDALRVASAFPNIVALPILIFPTLCEFPVVYDAFYEGPEGSTEAERFRSCVDQSNAMIFVYFFGYNLVFWILGYPTLVAAGQRRQMKNERSLSTTELHLPADTINNEETEIQINVHTAVEHEQQNINDATTDEASNEVLSESQPEAEQIQSTNNGVRARIGSTLRLVSNAIMLTIKGPGFIAMILGIITACIPPLRDALFSQGGALRFFGSAMESLGMAGASVGTLVVAASLVHQAADDSPLAEGGDNAIDASQAAPNHNRDACGIAELAIPSENNNARERSSEDHPKDLRSSMRRRRSSLTQMSSKAIAAIRRRKPTIRMHAWFIFSRLIVAPAVVCLLLMAMDCGGVLDGIPNVALAKMVVIVNAGLPGAQLIVLTLKSKGLSGSASIVAQVYLPSYLLSIVTIAAWCSLGLMISVPREDGTSFCIR